MSYMPSGNLSVLYGNNRQGARTILNLFAVSKSNATKSNIGLLSKIYI